MPIKIPANNPLTLDMCCDFANTPATNKTVPRRPFYPIKDKNQGLPGSGELVSGLCTEIPASINIKTISKGDITTTENQKLEI